MNLHRASVGFDGILEGLPRMHRLEIIPVPPDVSGKGTARACMHGARRWGGCGVTCSAEDCSRMATVDHPPRRGQVGGLSVTAGRVLASPKHCHAPLVSHWPHASSLWRKTRIIHVTTDAKR
jgi:hypothetical protein